MILYTWFPQHLLCTIQYPLFMYSIHIMGGIITAIFSFNQHVHHLILSNHQLIWMSVLILSKYKFIYEMLNHSITFIKHKCTWLKSVYSIIVWMIAFCFRCQLGTTHGFRYIFDPNTHCPFPIQCNESIHTTCLWKHTEQRWCIVPFRWYRYCTKLGLEIYIVEWTLSSSFTTRWSCFTSSCF